MQYFIGVIPPEQYQDKVQRFQKLWENKLSEPHITIKAPSALTSDLKWLPDIEEICARTKPFEVILGEPNFFGEMVLYLSVVSPDIILLHNEIVNKVSPSLELSKRIFENADFIPHLTLGITSDVITFAKLEQMRAAVESSLSPYPSFTVSSIRIYKKDTDEEHYSKYKDIKLGSSLETIN